MKLKYKKKNCPRLQCAITKVISDICCCRWWNLYDARSIGILIQSIAYGADKYDVLNKLVIPGNHRKIVTFCRGDIRVRSNIFEIINILTLLLLLIYVAEILYGMIL